MFKTINAYIFKKYGTNNLVVINKSNLSKAKDEDFEEVALVLTLDEIKEMAEEIEMLGLDEEDYD